MSDPTTLYQQVIAKCWADESFKQQVLADPVSAFKREGIEIPAGVRLQVLENTEQVFHLVIPARPTEVTDDMLAGAAGGGYFDMPTGYFDIPKHWHMKV